MVVNIYYIYIYIYIYIFMNNNKTISASTVQVQYNDNKKLVKNSKNRVITERIFLWSCWSGVSDVSGSNSNLNM